MMLLLVSTAIKFLSIVKGYKEINVVSDGGLLSFCRCEHYKSLVQYYALQQNKYC